MPASWPVMAGAEMCPGDTANFAAPEAWVQPLAAANYAALVAAAALASAPGPHQGLPMGLDLSARLPPSSGSALHAAGKCSPCAWYWKPRGCQNAYQCQFCHLCPAGELKNRKKAKVASRKASSSGSLGDVLAATTPRQDAQAAQAVGDFVLNPKAAEFEPCSEPIRVLALSALL